MTTEQGAPDHGATELKPCPICGGEAEIKTPRYETVDGRAWFVGCVHRANPPHDTPTRESVFYAYGSTAEEAAAAWNRRAASPSPPPVGVEVVKLEWDADHEASSPVGNYRVQRLDGKWEPTRNGLYMLPKRYGVVDAFDTIDEAKAAAQADFERRIRSALVPSSPSLIGEAQEALREALVAMTIAKALPGVADEYDFEPAIAEVTKALAKLGAAS